MFVVSSLTTDSGVGTATVQNRFGYAGAKLEINGRGYLGFREMRQQIDSPDGTSKLTTVRKFFQQHPYIGSVAVSETYLGPLSPMNAPRPASCSVAPRTPTATPTPQPVPRTAPR